MLQPEPAAELGRRKARNLLATGAEAVIAGNPGCALQIAAHSERLGRRLRVYHPMELLSMSIDGGRPREMSIESARPWRGGSLRRDPDRRRARLRGALHERFERRRARSCWRARASAGRGSPPARTLDFLDETREVREGDWRVAPPPADLQDRRVEITGPDRPQDGHQRAQLRRPWLHGRLRGLQLADLGEHDRRPRQPVRRDRRHDRVHVAGRQGVRARRRGRDAARAPARLASAREPSASSTASRSPGALFDFGLYFFHNARRAARPRQRAVLLPAEAGEPPARRGCGTTCSSSPQDAARRRPRARSRRRC